MGVGDQSAARPADPVVGGGMLRQPVGSRAGCGQQGPVGRRTGSDGVHPSEPGSCAPARSLPLSCALDGGESRWNWGRVAD